MGRSRLAHDSRDLTALPCSHPHCASVGYLLKDDSDTWRSLTGIVGHDQLKQWLDLAPENFANRITDQVLPEQMRTVVKEAVLGLLSEQTSLSHPQVADLWKAVCQTCDLGLSTLTTAHGRAGQADQRQALHGHRDDDRGTAHPVLRARGHPGLERRPVRPFCAVQAWAPLSRQKIGVSAIAKGDDVPVSLPTPVVLSAGPASRGPGH